MHTIHDEHLDARKQHCCHMCGRTIEPGERYHRERVADYGDIWTWKNCAHCDVVIDVLIAHDLRGDFGIDANAMADFEPRTILEARLKAGVGAH